MCLAGRQHLGTTMENVCFKCGITDEETTTIKKCVICFRYYCEECGWDRAGRSFCSKQCSDFFFFGDED
jgi:hypothetical protein